MRIYIISFSYLETFENSESAALKLLLKNRITLKSLRTLEIFHKFIKKSLSVLTSTVETSI